MFPFDAKFECVPGAYLGMIHPNMNYKCTIVDPDSQTEYVGLDSDPVEALNKCLHSLTLGRLDEDEALERFKETWKEISGEELGEDDPE